MIVVGSEESVCVENGVYLVGGIDYVVVDGE